jgi:hypothetical protein
MGSAREDEAPARRPGFRGGAGILVLGLFLT